jgi:hypothetical protein
MASDTLGTCLWQPWHKCFTHGTRAAPYTAGPRCMTAGTDSYGLPHVPHMPPPNKGQRLVRLWWAPFW